MSFLQNEGEFLKFEYHTRYTHAFIMHSAHIHPQYELYFCPEEIEQVVIINGAEYTYRGAAAILSSPYTLHSMSFVPNSSSLYERYVFHIGERAAETLTEKRFMPSVPNVFEKNVGILFNLVDSEAKELREFAEICLKCRTLAEKELAISLFIRRLTSLCPADRISRMGQPSFYIQDILRYICRNFEKKINTAELAKEFSISRSKLDRDFRSFTGMTVHGYINTCRLNQSKYILARRDDLSIGEIANMCGFESESSFFHFFKRMTKETPTEFKNSIKKINQR